MKKPLLFLFVLLSAGIMAQPLRITGAEGGTPFNVFEYNNLLYFSGSITGTSNVELCVYDNSLPISATNPKMLIDLDSSSSTGSSPNHLTVYNGKLFFTTNNGVYAYNDAAPLSATNPKYICPRAEGFTVYNNNLYFAISMQGTTRRLPWVYDDNLPVNFGVNPKVVVQEIVSPVYVENGFYPYVYGSKLYFSANKNTASGNEVWVYDDALPASVNNPKQLANLQTDVSNIDYSLNGSYPGGFIEYQGNMYFSVIKDNGSALMKYDGANFTTVASELNEIGFSTNKIIHNGIMYFAHNTSANGYELWSYNGTDAPVMMLDLKPGSGSSYPMYLTPYGDKLLFAANDGVKGMEVWFYDPSAIQSSANPFRVTNLNGNNDGLNPFGSISTFALYGNHIYYGGYGDGYGERGLYAISTCDLRLDNPPVFTLGADVNVQVGDTLVLNAPANMVSNVWNPAWTIGSTSGPDYTFVATEGNMGENPVILRVINSAGCVAYDTIKLTTVPATGVGINGLHASQYLTIYPNPSQGAVTIQASATISEVQILNIAGQQVYHALPDINKVMWQPQTPGIYFVKVKSQGNIVSRKVVITE